LPELCIFIVDYEYKSFFESIIEIIFDLSKPLHRIIGGELSEIPPEFIEITIKIIEPVKRPVIVPVLNFVFSEGHLVAIIELGPCIKAKQGKKDDDDGFFQGLHP
jgi:hypothetical protein